MSTRGTEKRLAAAGAGRYWWIWFFVATVIAWTFVRLFGLDRGVPLVPVMAFTPYLAVAALLVAGVATALRNWAAAAVQELTPRFARGLRQAGIGSRLPEAVEEIKQGAAGGGVYSRFPLRPIDLGSATFFRQPRVALTLPSGRRIRVVDIHPLTPGRTGIDVWEDSLGDLPVTGDGVPWVLLGDFNATLDHSRLREVLDRGYRDAGDVAGMGLAPTWPNRGHDLPFPLITIDHVLADERLDFVDYGVEDLPGSDHRSIHAELVLPEPES